MLILDASAVLTILFEEPGAPKLLACLEADSERLMSTGAFVELSAVLTRKFGATDSGRILQDFLNSAAIQLCPLTEVQAYMAQEAYNVYPGLNLGETFSYALAKDKGAALLYSGEALAQTDVQLAAA